jgi:hypothetical protein
MTPDQILSFFGDHDILKLCKDFKLINSSKINKSTKPLLYVGFVGDDVDVDGHEESESSVTEGDRREQLRLLLRRAADPGAVGKNHLELTTDVLEETITY